MDNQTTTDRVCHHIYIGYTSVHDVDGVRTLDPSTGYYIDSGGIAVEYNVSAHNGSGGSAPNRYDDVTIDSNTITAVDSIGIFLSFYVYSGLNDPDCPNIGLPFDCKNAKPKTTNVAIRDNIVTCTAWHSILVELTSGAILEHNTASKGGRSNFVGSGCNSSSGNSNPPQLAGVWSTGSVGATIQYNEVYDLQPGSDAEAFDSDWGNVSNTIQYNYSHNNYGGFLLVWETHNEVGCSTSTTVASGSNNLSLPQTTINVASTAAFPSSGQFYVTTSAGSQLVSYTGKTSTQFTGCSGGTGTMATGNDVSACGTSSGTYVCDSESTYDDDLMVRWNVSVNDGTTGSAMITFCGGGRDQRWWLYCDVNAWNHRLSQFPFGSNPPDIMNNSFYQSSSKYAAVVRGCGGNTSTAEVVGRSGDALYFYNNIVYPVNPPRGFCLSNRAVACSVNADCSGWGGTCCSTSSGGCQSNTSFIANMLGGVDYPSGSRNGSAVFDVNTYYGSFTPSNSELKGASDYYEDPLFLAPAANGPTGEYPPTGRTNVRMQLHSGSPAAAGVHGGYNSGYLGSLDFWGNSVSSTGTPNRGAFNGTPIALTVDATSGWFMPASSSEWTTLLSGTGISNPSSLWLAQESSGYLYDSINTRTFIVVGTPSYRQSVTGWTRLSVKPRTDSSDYFGSHGVNVSTTSAMLMFILRVNTPPSTQRSILQMSDSETNEVDINSSGYLVARNKANSATGSISVANKTIVLIMKIDRSIPQMVVYNDTSEVLKPTWSAPASTDSFYIGNGASWPDASVLYMAYWTGTSAQLSDSTVTTLINRIKNGP